MNHPVTSAIEWRGQATAEGVIERSFMLSRRSGVVPGVLWSPRTSARPPAVLLGHGGSGHKRSERHLRMGHWLASTPGDEASWQEFIGRNARVRVPCRSA